MASSSYYDLAYRLWAPWDVVGVRPELQRMIEDDGLSPANHPNVIDLGCGSGANTVFPTTHGFQVTTVDVAPTGLRTAERRAVPEGVAERCRFIAADLTAPDLLDPIKGPPAAAPHCAVRAGIRTNVMTTSRTRGHQD